MSQEDQTNLPTLLNPTDAAQIIEAVSDTQAVDLIEDLPPEQAANIVDELQSDQQADLRTELDTEEAEAILQEIPVPLTGEVHQLLSYPADTAGGLMVTEYLAYKDNLQVGNIVDDLTQLRQPKTTTTMATPCCNFLAFFFATTFFNNLIHIFVR